MPPTQIIINVFGGNAQDVYCSDPAARVTVVDWDAQKYRDDDPGIVEVMVDGHRPQYALVANSRAKPLSDLAGSDVEVAIEAAEANPCP